MPMPTDLAAYEDLRPKLERALSEPSGGVRIRCPTPGKATHLAQRINTFRKLDRAASLDIYPEGDERRGVSAFDSLSIERDGTDVLVKNVGMDEVLPL